IVMTFAELGTNKGRVKQTLRYLLDPALGNGGMPISLGIDSTFESKADAQPYRRLEMEGRPENLKLLMDGNLLGEVPRKEVDKRVGFLMTRAAKPPVGQPAFSPHDGLGVFVTLGTVSVRSVTIQPLQK